MIVGSFIAGSTPIGGGVVAFPLSVLYLKFNALEARDSAVMVQATGMNAASFLLFYAKPGLLDSQFIIINVIVGAWGVLLGLAAKACLLSSPPRAPVHPSMFPSACGPLPSISCGCSCELSFLFDQFSP